MLPKDVLTLLRPRKSLVTSPRSASVIPKTDTLASTILASILSQHSAYFCPMIEQTNFILYAVWLLRDEDGEDYDNLLEHFLSLPSLPDVQVNLHCSGKSNTIISYSLG